MERVSFSKTAFGKKMFVSDVMSVSNVTQCTAIFYSGKWIVLASAFPNVTFVVHLSLWLKKTEGRKKPFPPNRIFCCCWIF